MPCLSGPSEAELWHEERLKNDRVTALLCALCQRIEEGPSSKVINEDPALVAWWQEHKRLDAERKAQEARDFRRKRVAEEARSKLTREERIALGIER